MKDSAQYPEGYAARLFKLHKSYMETWSQLEDFQHDAPPSMVVMIAMVHKFKYANLIEFKDGPKRFFLKNYVQHSLQRILKRHWKVQYSVFCQS